MAGKEVDAGAEAIHTIRVAGRSELLTQAALEDPARARPQRRASEGVAAGIMACSLPQTRRGKGEEASPRHEEAHGLSAPERAIGRRSWGRSPPGALVSRPRRRGGN